MAIAIVFKDEQWKVVQSLIEKRIQEEIMFSGWSGESEEDIRAQYKPLGTFEGSPSDLWEGLTGTMLRENSW